MRNLGQVVENEMVLAFLQAEIDSGRFGHIYAAILANSRVRRESLIDQPDRLSDRDNSIRTELLTVVRGFGNRTLLFQHFPPDVTWRRAVLEAADLDTLIYANHETWRQLSGGSRRVTDGARNVEAFSEGNVRENTNVVLQAYRVGKRYPPLIGVDGPGRSIILVEGHTRATAYVLGQVEEPIEALVGSSPRMEEWAYY